MWLSVDSFGADVPCIVVQQVRESGASIGITCAQYLMNNCPRRSRIECKTTNEILFSTLSLSLFLFVYLLPVVSSLMWLVFRSLLLSTAFFCCSVWSVESNYEASTGGIWEGICRGECLVWSGLHSAMDKVQPYATSIIKGKRQRGLSSFSAVCSLPTQRDLKIL